MVTLCDGTYNGIKVHREAYLKDGQLRIDGQDLGASVAKFWGEHEYEYFYLFSREMTELLHVCLKKDSKTNDKLLVLVARYFSGDLGDIRLREYSEINNVKYEFQNYY
jgi:hypothetical protein